MIGHFLQGPHPSGAGVPSGELQGAEGPGRGKIPSPLGCWSSFKHLW